MEIDSSEAKPEKTQEDKKTEDAQEMEGKRKSKLRADASPYVPLDSTTTSSLSSLSSSSPSANLTEHACKAEKAEDTENFQKYEVEEQEWTIPPDVSRECDEWSRKGVVLKSLREKGRPG